MMNTDKTQGERIRTLFRQASHAAIIAPFIKTDALRSLLDVIPAQAAVRCVTRWLPAEIAAGVSDLEVLDVLEERAAHELLLVDRLHAKLYIADNQCLAGSANVTLSGLGETTDAGNIEILVEADLEDPAVAAALRSIESNAIPATRSDGGRCPPPSGDIAQSSITRLQCCMASGQPSPGAGLSSLQRSPERIPQRRQSDAARRHRQIKPHPGARRA